MTQWGHAQPEEGARAKKVARRAVWITVWSVVLAFAMFCVVSEALAETYTPHARRITPRYNTAHYVTHGTKARASARGVRGGRTTAHKVSVESSRRAVGRSSRFEPVREPASSRKSNGGEMRSARSAQPASTSMHRVSGHRRSGERRHGSERMDVVAGTNAHAVDSPAGTALPSTSLFANRAHTSRPLDLPTVWRIPTRTRTCQSRKHRVAPGCVL